MKSADIITRLEAEGWHKVGGKGNHMKFKHPAKAGHVVVPHPRKDMAIGTLRALPHYRGMSIHQALPHYRGMSIHQTHQTRLMTPFQPH